MRASLRTLRPYAVVSAALAAVVVLTQLALVARAGVGWVVTDGRVGDELFGEACLVHLGPGELAPAGAERAAEELLAEARERWPALEPALVPRDGGRALRVFPRRGEDPPLRELTAAAARRGLDPGVLSLGPRFLETLDALARGEAALGPVELGWVLLPTPLAFALVALVARRRRAPRPEPRLGPRAAVAAGIAASLLLLWLAALLADVLDELGLQVREQPMVEALIASGGAARALFAFMAIVLAPLGEELFFRSFAFEYLRRERGLLAAHVVSGVLFAAIHLNPAGIPLYLLFAAVLGECWRRSGTLIVPAVAHAVLNAAAVAAHLAG